MTIQVLVVVPAKRVTDRIPICANGTMIGEVGEEWGKHSIARGGAGVSTLRGNRVRKIR